MVSYAVSAGRLGPLRASRFAGRLGPLRASLIVTALALAGCGHAQRPRTAPLPPLPPAERTSIQEFPHPRVNVHYHPQAGHQFVLADAQFALDHHCEDIELDLHMRDGEVVCNHDGPTPQAPRLVDVIDAIVRKKGNSPTVYGDGQQFFLVLEPKDNDTALLDGVVAILKRYERYLSTAVGPKDGPRPITVIITGGQTGHLRDMYAGHVADLNRLCLLENRDYSGEIVNRTKGNLPFQWATFRHPDEQGRINALHSGTDARLRGKYNVRVWGEGRDLYGTYLAGTDSINTDHDQVEPFEAMLHRHAIQGVSPSLSLHGVAALLTWKDADTDDIRLSLGRSEPSGLSFGREIDLSTFLEGKPKGNAPASAILPDGRVLVVYQNGEGQPLSAITGRFTSFEKFPAFDGGPYVLAPSTAGARHPSLAVLPDGRVVLVYEAGSMTGNRTGLRGLVGRVDASGVSFGTASPISAAHAGSASAPAVTADRNGRLLLLYRTADGHAWRLSGRLDPQGRLTGTEAPAPPGTVPDSVATTEDGRVVLTFADAAGNLTTSTGPTLDAAMMAPRQPLEASIR